jgi:hypothetical protein
MEIKPSDLVLKLAKESINLAMECVETGETLLAFILADGDPGAIHSLAGGSFAEVLNMAQEVVDGFGTETTAFAFVYDGFITLRGERTDCIYVEASEIGEERIFKFAQRYRPKKFSHPVERIGNFMCLERGEPKLSWNA